MTFMMTSQMMTEVIFVIFFFVKTYSILSIQYMYKISCKNGQNSSEIQHAFHHGPTSPPPSPDIVKKAQPGRVTRQPHKIVENTQTIRRQKPTNCLSLFDHLALKGLSTVNQYAIGHIVYFAYLHLKDFVYLKIELLQTGIMFTLLSATVTIRYAI